MQGANILDLLIGPPAASVARDISSQYQNRQPRRDFKTGVNEMVNDPLALQKMLPMLMMTTAPTASSQSLQVEKQLAEQMKAGKLNIDTIAKNYGMKTATRVSNRSNGLDALIDIEDAANNGDVELGKKAVEQIKSAAAGSPLAAYKSVADNFAKLFMK